MLLALVFRGARSNSARFAQHIWLNAFTAGSTLAAFARRHSGRAHSRHPGADGAYSGGLHCTPFALCGLALVAGYALLGAAWLTMKTEGPVAVRSRAQAKTLLLVVLGFMAAVSVWTPLTEPRIAARWFSLPNFYFLWPVPVVTALVAFLLWRWLEKGREVPPFLAVIALFLLGYLGLVISNFPYLVPPSLTVWDTAAAPASQIFMLLGTLVLLPLILGYVAFIYWLFRGKVREGESYH